MKTSECRVGNYVALKNNSNYVTTIQPSSLEYGMIENKYEPIPIDKTWLKKFGLDDSMEFKNPFEDKDNFQITKSEDRWMVCFNNIVPIYIDHVHELQNMYQMFMGKELKAD